MNTILNVNGLSIHVEYHLDVSSVYLGDLESEYIEINPIKETASLPVLEDGVWVNKVVDITQVIDILEMQETLKLVLRDRMESIE